jgi:hypothetical protein
MTKEFIVDGALCMCKFGTSPGRLKVPEQQFAYMNGGKLTATTMSLGNAFYPPGFTVCRFIPLLPKPCTPAIVLWTEGFRKLEIGNGGYALTEKSKGTCASGCPNCIDIMLTGQFQLPGIGQILSAKAAFQNEMDPIGESVALTDHQVDSLLDIY